MKNTNYIMITEDIQNRRIVHLVQEIQDLTVSLGKNATPFVAAGLMDAAQELKFHTMNRIRKHLYAWDGVTKGRWEDESGAEVAIVDKRNKFVDLFGAAILVAFN